MNITLHWIILYKQRQDLKIPFKLISKRSEYQQQQLVNQRVNCHVPLNVHL